MNSALLNKRRSVMRRSMALGHCICNPRLACPCEEFRRHDICHCAGERAATPADAPVRLTEHVRNPGCASKIDKKTLQQVLAGLPELADPRVLVGASCGDDAGVMVLHADDRRATILTVDVFTPVVDDPCTFGQIAAANSVSDIYAMGGTPHAALSIIGFPTDTLPAHALREILRGGADKMREAGVVVIGGHSINDQEPKCGFAVIGTCPRDGFIRNADARAGDAIVLTKPLGTGILAFARQIGRIDQAAMDAAVRSMASLNKFAGELLTRHAVHAATDVTGFGLLGHMSEIARHSGAAGVVLELDWAAIPLFDGVVALAAAEVLPGACERNREALDESLLTSSALTAGEAAILFGPETSGGILAFLPPDRATAFVRALLDRGVTASIIGRVAGEHPGGRITVSKPHAKHPPTPPTEDTPMSEPAPAVASASSPMTPNTAASASSPMAPNTAASASSPMTPESSACCCHESPAQAAPATGLPSPAHADALKTYLAAVNAPGALEVKHKKLISLALSIVCKCEPCVRLNAQAAREAGAAEAEIAEAAALGIAFGGSSAMMFYNQARKVN